MNKSSESSAARRRHGRGFLAIMAIMAIVASSAWAAASRDAIELWSGDDQWVRIERQDSGAAANDHPVELSTEQVGGALGALRLSVTDAQSGTQVQRAVFTREEIADLASRVAAGLRRAGPTQDVTFSTIGSHALSTGGLLRDPGVNAGRIFYRDGKLNVIFGELQSNYRKRNFYGQRTEDFAARRQGFRDKVSEQKFALAPSPGIELNARSGAVRSDWVLIDPRVAGVQAAPPAVPPGAPPAGTSAVASPRAAAAPAAVTTADSPPAGQNQNLEQRLQRLKDLRDKGLISEEAYNSRVRELLSEL